METVECNGLVVDRLLNTWPTQVQFRWPTINYILQPLYDSLRENGHTFLDNNSELIMGNNLLLHPQKFITLNLMSIKHIETIT